MPDHPDLNADLQATAQEDAPVVIDKRPQSVAVDTNQLDTTPRVVDGRVRSSEDISDQAVEQGYEPDIQPKAAAPGSATATGLVDSLTGGAVSEVLTDSTAGQITGLRMEGKDAEADEILEKSLAAKTAFEQLTAPLSVKSEAAGRTMVEEGEVTINGQTIQKVEASELKADSGPSVPDVTKAPESSGEVPLEHNADAPVLTHEMDAPAEVPADEPVDPAVEPVDPNQP